MSLKHIILPRRARPANPKLTLARNILHVVLGTTALALSVATWGPLITTNTTILYVAIAACYSITIPLIANAIEVFNDSRVRVYCIKFPAGQSYRLRASRSDLRKYLQAAPGVTAEEIDPHFS